MKKYFFICVSIVIMGLSVFILSNFFPNQTSEDRAGENLKDAGSLFYSPSLDNQATEIFGIRDEKLQKILTIEYSNAESVVKSNDDLILDHKKVFNGFGTEIRKDIGDGVFTFPSPYGSYLARIDGNSAVEKNRAVRIFNRRFESFAVNLPIRDQGYWRPFHWSADEEFLFFVPFDDPHNGCEPEILKINVQKMEIERVSLSERKVCVLDILREDEFLGIHQDDPKGRVWVFSSDQDPEKLENVAPDLDSLPPLLFSSRQPYMIYFSEREKESNAMVIYDWQQNQILQSILNVRFLGWDAGKAFFATVNQPTTNLIQWDPLENQLITFDRESEIENNTNLIIRNVQGQHQSKELLDKR